MPSIKLRNSGGKLFLLVDRFNGNPPQPEELHPVSDNPTLWDGGGQNVAGFLLSEKEYKLVLPYVKAKKVGDIIEVEQFYLRYPERKLVVD